MINYYNTLLSCFVKLLGLIKLMSCQYHQEKDKQNLLICHEMIIRSPEQISGKDTRPREPSSTPSDRNPSDLYNIQVQFKISLAKFTLCSVANKILWEDLSSATLFRWNDIFGLFDVALRSNSSPKLIWLKYLSNFLALAVRWGQQTQAEIQSKHSGNILHKNVNKWIIRQ